MVEYKRFRIAYPGGYGRTAFKVISFADTEHFNALAHAKALAKDLCGILTEITVDEYEAEKEGWSHDLVE